jgi:DNA-binding transcriptional MerR regulator
LDKAPDAFRTISEVADEIDVPQHVLRFWESRFVQIRPMKRGGGRRYYRPDDVDLLRGVRHLLYGEGYTIRGVQRILREQGAAFVQNVWRAGTEPPPPESADDRAGGENAEGAAGARVEPNVSVFASAAAGKLPVTAATAERREPKIAAAASGGEAARLSVTVAARRKLQTVLDELVECRRLIDAALSEAALVDNDANDAIDPDGRSAEI